jgi:hypothetical protein
MPSIVTLAVQAFSGVALVGGGLFAVRATRPAVRRALAVARADPVAPTAVDDAYGHATGTAVPLDDSLEAPFTGDEAVAYDCEVEQESHEILSSRTVEREAAAVPLAVETGGGRARVHGGGATVALDRSTTLEVPGGEEPPERIQAYNEDARLDPQHTPVGDVVELSRGWDRAYHEGAAAPGDELTVVGRFETPERPDPDVDAVVAGGGRPFVLTNRSPLRAALAAERHDLWVGLGGVAAALVGVAMLVVATRAAL